MTEDLRRLLHPEAPTLPALRRALERARGEVPSPAQLDQLAARLGPLLGGPGGGGTPGGGRGTPGEGGAASSAGVGGQVAAAGGFGMAAKGGLLVAAAAVVAYGTWLGLRPREAPPVETPGAATQGAATQTEPPPRASETAPAAPAEPRTPDDVALAVSRAESRRRRPPPLPAAHPPAPEPTLLQDEAAPVALDPQAEVRLLEQAQDALATSPTRALALAGQHARRFPAGMLAQEREVLAVQALLRLGRFEAAASRVSRFERRWPQSSHRRRLQSLLAGAP